MDVFETVLKTLPDSGEICESVNTITLDPLETDDKAKDSTLNNGETRANLNEVVDAVLQRLKNANEIVVGISETKASIITNAKFRKPKPGETEEQQEKRLMKQRIIQMKNRLLLQLEGPERAQVEKERATRAARLIREKRKAAETPEQTAIRKLRQRSIVARSRKRIKELETPEQQAKRTAKQNEKKKLKNQEMTAKETPEQRAIRKKREQSYRDKYRQHKLAMKTGKIRGQARVTLQ